MMKSRLMRRIHADVRELKKSESPLYTARPMEDDMLRWHFTVRGPLETEFEGGIYHGMIVLPGDWPFKPPTIVWLTPTGRFEVRKPICLSISAYHPEQWQPAWGIRTILEALISFMPTPGKGAIGALDWSSEERKKLAQKSISYAANVPEEYSKHVGECTSIPPAHSPVPHTIQYHHHTNIDNSSYLTMLHSLPASSHNLCRSHSGLRKFPKLTKENSTAAAVKPSEAPKLHFHNAATETSPSTSSNSTTHAQRRRASAEGNASLENKKEVERDSGSSPVNRRISGHREDVDEKRGSSTSSHDGEGPRREIIRRRRHGVGIERAAVTTTAPTKIGASNRAAASPSLPPPDHLSECLGFAVIFVLIAAAFFIVRRVIVV